MNNMIMEVPDADQLKHLQIQAMLRENNFPEDELKYIGERDGQHYYLIAGEHEVPVSDIISCDQITE
tara:strand:- start:5534 stop:5734 length:201 start_codon:yes stop_codon:yes gene_type:complete